MEIKLIKLSMIDDNNNDNYYWFNNFNDISHICPY